MHLGEFPVSYLAGSSHFVPHTGKRNELDTNVSRRAWLAGVIGIATVGAATTTYASLAPRTPAHAASHAAMRGTFEWALTLLAASDDELLLGAGDLERLRMREPNNARLVPCFVRLLDVSLSSDDANADAAGACAIRSFGQMRRADLLRAAETSLQGRRDRPETAGALQEALEQLPRRRGNG